ncbi:MAG TPA: hypothetical protein VGS07_13645 [Thermoanaerobaculia bacterium]|jgi:hypothetical protein|nr:hypothetical protein [Thermoanaerobaculia bacterium]
MKKTQKILTGAALGAIALVLTTGAVHAAPPPCNEPVNTMGTVTLPPAGCQYLSPSQVHMIINGLPPGTTIILAPIHQNFICRTSTPPCHVAGGPLGGEVENFTSTAVFSLSGTGALSGWNRTVTVPLTVQVATAPRTAGASVQTFSTNMEIIQGAISGDPDFASFQVVGGTANGFSSPGSTTLTRQSNGTFNVSSGFNVGYSIKFVGASGGHLAGLSGTTEGTVVMQAQASPQK